MRVRFSVMVTVYNAEKYIGACLDALLAQTYTDFEIVVIDDGSTDQSALICDAYAERDRRVRVLHTENSGVLRARALAEQKAAGEYLIHCDGDDLVLPDMLRVFSDVIDRTSADLICCDFSLFHGDSEPIRERFFSQDRLFEGAQREEIYRLLLSTRFNTLCNKCFSRARIASAPDYANLHRLRHGEDLLRSAYLVTSAQKIAYVCGSFYLYRRDVGHSGSFDPESLRLYQTVDETIRRLLSLRVRWDEAWQTQYNELCRKQLDNYIGLLIRSGCSVTQGARILQQSATLPIFQNALQAARHTLKYTMLRRRQFRAVMLLGRGKGWLHA